MTQEDLYGDDFIIRLSIDGSEYEEVEVKLEDPNKTIRDLISSIVSVFELPKVDNGGNPIHYLLGHLMEDDVEPHILDFEDCNGREQTIMDHDIQPGDCLKLISIPIPG